ncbi:aspartate kinase [Gammaproteobacteria bacterium]|jgi:aspartate kinase|nr:aspartate kinase [Gammaproteobacteria bacterium]MDC1251176.1 aspartate kinase [Gammaproteobacteria bacterium]MDC3323266.1 aspartate kinase [Gammaproteobacteria bacterium]|tara:strand:- start:2528 stop:3757 length:1230 start_codon:yes stop_codon:yes gene_type:complete
MGRLIVKKFGGTSVADSARIEAVADNVEAEIQKGNKVTVVLSAMGKSTDALIELAKEINPEPDLREYDALVSTGEQISVALLAMALLKRGIKGKSYTAYQLGIKTNSSHSRARILDVEVSKITAELDNGVVPVITGFQGMNELGDITTLGRGGSDTTGVALAVALKADECQIYTDVDGVYTTDPRVCPKARLLKEVSFEEMLELSSSGAKVLQLRAVEYASKFNLPLRVLSSFNKGEGTLVQEEKNIMERPIVSGISSIDSEAKLTMRGVPDIPGVAAKILSPISEAGIEVDVIVQNISAENNTDFTFTVDKADAKKAEAILQEVSISLEGGSIEVDDDIAKISIVGRGMRAHAGVASKMFQALAKSEINISMITTSEIKISVVIKKSEMANAVSALHDAFDLDKELDS